MVCGARDVNVKLWQVTGAPRTHWFFLCRVLSYIFLSIISRESRSINFKDVLLLFASDVFMASSKISQFSMSTVWNIHRFSREISSVLGNLFQAQMKCWERKFLVLWTFCRIMLWRERWCYILIWFNWNTHKIRGRERFVGSWNIHFSSHQARRSQTKDNKVVGGRVKFHFFFLFIIISLWLCALLSAMLSWFGWTS